MSTTAVIHTSTNGHLALQIVLRLVSNQITSDVDKPRHKAYRLYGNTRHDFELGELQVSSIRASNRTMEMVSSTEKSRDLYVRDQPTDR